MTPTTYFIAWCIMSGGVMLVIAGFVAALFGVLPADERGAELGTPRPWGLVFGGLVAMIVGVSSFFTIIEFWRQW